MIDGKKLTTESLKSALEAIEYSLSMPDAIGWVYVAKSLMGHIFWQQQQLSEVTEENARLLLASRYNSDVADQALDEAKSLRAKLAAAEATLKIIATYAIERDHRADYAMRDLALLATDAIRPTYRGYETSDGQACDGNGRIFPKL